MKHNKLKKIKRLLFKERLMDRLIFLLKWKIFIFSYDSKDSSFLKLKKKKILSKLNAIHYEIFLSFLNWIFV